MLRRPIVAVLALAAATLAVLPTPASATAPKQVDPKLNITMPFYNECFAGKGTGPATVACSAKMVGTLNAARKQLTGTTYSLPSTFLKLAPTEQLLILANSDRAYYGLDPIAGFNATLNASAKVGIKDGGDPPFVNVSSHSPYLAGSNWAGGDGPYGNVLAAYYGWMYDDGLNKDGSSANSDCSKSHPSGCWGHRHNVLQQRVKGTTRYLGAATGPQPGEPGGISWTMLFENFASSSAISMIPTVVSLSPTSGTHKGGTVVTLKGYGFSKTSNAYVYSTSAKFKVTSNTSMTVTTPAHAAASGGHITLKTNGGSSPTTGAELFSYT